MDKSLKSFEQSLSNVINAYVEGETDLEDVLRMADKVQCYKANVGLNKNRLKHNPREQAFHDQWQQENAPVVGVNSGHGILQDLFMQHDPIHSLSPFVTSKIIEEISSRDRMIVATVIQWLGSNCGMGFLNEALSRFGSRIVEMPIK